MKTRFSPSPTGLMHLGNLRTALFSFLLAKPFSENDPGIFLLRIEDTDRVRSTEEFTQGIFRDMRWMQLDWQEGPEIEGSSGPYFQNQRDAIYQRYYDQLLAEKKAYWCFCSETELQIARKNQLSAGLPPRYSGTCRHLTEAQMQAKRDKGLKPALRFRIPDNETIEYEDFVQGHKSFQASVIGDFIIKKNDGSASFMFCNAIDDALMGVTHAMRGEDHLTNTPRQLLILQAVNLKAPRYGHMALILGDDGKPLSKRNGSQSIEALREQGFFPLAIANYLARLGHHFPEEKLLDFYALAEGFHIENFSRSPARFDAHQLVHWQKETMRQMKIEALWEWMAKSVSFIDQELQLKFVETIRDNVVTLKDVQDWANHLFTPHVPMEKIQEAGKSYFNAALTGVAQYGLDAKAIFAHIQNACGLKGKQLFMPMRLALTGVEHGPEMLKIFTLLGKEELLSRLKAAQAIA